jgi:ribosomal protein L5
MKFIEYLQQPNSIYALMALTLNTRAGGMLSVKDKIVNVRELKQRWHDLIELGFAQHVSCGNIEKWKIRLGWRVGYILTEKGDKASEALLEVIKHCKIS